MLMGYQYQSFTFQLGTPLKIEGYHLLTAGNALLSRSSLGGYWMFDYLLRIFFLVALHLPLVRNINAVMALTKIRSMPTTN